MRKALYTITFFVILRHLTRLSDNYLAGDVGEPDPREGAKPKTVADLRSEQPNLPRNAYRVFKSGVKHQLNENYSAARREYQKLRNIETKNGITVDLYNISSTFRYNFDLLP